MMLHGPRRSAPRSVAEKATALYLNDHLSSATLTADLARRLRDWSAGSEPAARIAELAAELESDHAALAAILRRLDVAPDPARQAGTWLGERMGRLRLTASGAGDEPTGLLLALEALGLGIAANRSAFTTLRDLAEVQPALDPEQLDALIARATSQGSRLEDERRLAATHALTDAVAER